MSDGIARRDTTSRRDATLLDLLDRVIDHGVVLTGDITISVADIALIYLELRVLLASVERLQSGQDGDQRAQPGNPHA